jgi:hypothetical protein
MDRGLSGLREFVADLLEREGAAVERIEPEGLEVLAPPDLQRELQLPELVRLGFGAELPQGARRVTLESDWMERLERLLGERGRWQHVIPDIANPPPSDPERSLAHAVELFNATYRLDKVIPAWTRYWILTFRYTALSEEKRDGLLQVSFNLATGSTLDDPVDALMDLAADPAVSHHAGVPLGVQPPPPWDATRLKRVLGRALPLRILHRLAAFLQGMRRRQERDLARLYDYHSDLRREALAKLAVLEQKGAKSRDEGERERLRLAAIAREYEAKMNDLRQKYAMSIEAQWVQTLDLTMPVQRFEVLIRRRKGERRLSLDWNPWTRRLEQPPCEYSFTWERPRLVCDEALHLVSPAAHGACPGCARDFCRACHPQKCPRCGHPTEVS